MEQQAYGKRRKPVTQHRPPDGWDPFKHVLWCFQEDSEALQDALRELECEWKGREATKSSCLKQQLIRQIVIAFIIVTVTLFYVMELDIRAILHDISSSVLVIPSPAELMSVVASPFLTAHVREVNTTLPNVAPLVPLVMQLEGQLSTHPCKVIFKLRDRTSQKDAQDDWHALLQLQRKCALPTQKGTSESIKASYVVAEIVPDNRPIIQIPRNMVLSTLFAPEYVRDNCWLDMPANRARAKQLCTHNELMAFLLILEKRLQRQAVRKFKNANDKARLDMVSVPTLPYCLTRTNRKNAPFFTATQWEVVELLSPFRRISVDRVMTKLRTAFDYASDLARNGLLEGDARVLQGMLQVLERESDETLIDLDIRDSVSLIYSKGLADMNGEVAVAPAAYEFEAQLNVYSWAPDNKMWYRPDEMGLTWRARGAYLLGSEVKVNHGRLSNLETIYRFGITVPANPWGPVFFLRRGAPEGPFASFGSQGWVSAHAPLIRTTTDAELMLPLGLLTNRTIVRYGTMCFHRQFQAEERQLGCPPTMLGGSATDNKNAPDFDNLVNKTSTSQFLECDYRTTFNIFPFGYGSIMLQRNGPVGGFSRIQYQCLRAMLTEKDPSETDVDTVGGASLILAEERVANVLKEVCSLQLGSAQQAARILRGELSRQKAQAFEGDEECSRIEQTRSSCTTDHDEPMFLEMERDIDARRRVHEVTQMMLEATNEFEMLLQQCTSYFELIIKDIETWKLLRLEF